MAPGRGGRRRLARQLRALVTAVVTLLVLATSAHVLWRRSAAAAVGAQVAAALPAQADPDDYYLAYSKGGHVDHHVLYHGSDARSVDRLRSADVLFVGNSRLLFAFTSRDLRRFFAPRGLEYFMLAFGHREHDAFPRAIIRRFDLRPRLVIVNADEFFLGAQSAWADRVMDDTWFDAQKLWFEAEATHWARRHVHAWLPYLPDVWRNERELVAYRSRDDGTWLVASGFSGIGASFRPGSSERVELTEQKRRNARSFKAEIEARGGRLVLCLVPSPRADRGVAEALAREIGVPLVAPEPPGLRTFDGSHLMPESASAFAAAFFAELQPLLAEMRLRE